MKKLIGTVVAIIVVVLMVLAYIEIGKRTAHEGKVVVETSRGAVDKAKESAKEMNKRIDQTNKEVEKIFGEGKK